VRGERHQIEKKINKNYNLFFRIQKQLINLYFANYLFDYLGKFLLCTIFDLSCKLSGKFFNKTHICFVPQTSSYISTSGRQHSKTGTLRGNELWTEMQTQQKCQTAEQMRV
jgi:hypothetical protein